MAERSDKKEAAAGLCVPTLAHNDSKAKAVLAAFVANKRNDEYAVKHVRVHIYWFGHTRVTIWSDQETSAEDLRREATRKTG